MPRQNTHDTYGSVAKTFHWLTALLILTAMPLGLIANAAPLDTGEELARKAWLFSLHKTVGVTAFLVALARIGWAIGQVRPHLLNAERKAEAFLAQTIHWLLYGSLVIVPLSGWVHHAATTGFAPIFWPFGQSLPFVPVDDTWASASAGMHNVFTKVLGLSIALHIAGALKHHIIDRDATLRRMLPGQVAVPAAPTTRESRLPVVAALAVWALALTIGGSLGVFGGHGLVTTTERLDEVNSEWQVAEGTLAITVRQFGSDVEGRFEEFTAAIDFDETISAEVMGTVDVTVAIASLTLGSVTAQALGPDYFDATSHPTARFTAEILRAAEGYEAVGALTLRDTVLPVTLPFQLDIDGATAQMQGETVVNRLDFGIGANQPDDANLGFEVLIRTELTATRD